MIDFRYHLVSLVSVFLALAVGIVLGAGPLQDSIGNALTVSVERLRQEKDALRADLDTANASVTHRDTFLTDVTAPLVTGQLTGRSVVLISLPGVDSELAEPLVAAIDTAGGTVTGRITVQADWTAASAAQKRDEALAAINQEVGGTEGAGGSGDTRSRLDTLLAEALVATGADGTQRSTATSRAVLDRLGSADLIDVDGDLSGLAGSALVLAPPVDTEAAQPSPSAAAADFLPLAAAFDSVGGGAVVTGPASSATGAGLVAAVRKDDDVAEDVSTVDTGTTPMGVITAVLALREQVAGSGGQYGFGAGASDPMPALTANAGGSAGN